MPISTFLGVETALRGLVASQRALDITGHNIDNANTVGYTREQATLIETPPITEVPYYGQIGTGVTIQGYQRLRDAILDTQLRAQTMLQSYQDARSDVLQQVETTLNEPSSSGVQSQLDAFWSSWQDVANSPENLATRQSLLQSASSLASGLQSLRGQFTTIDSTTQQAMGLTINDLNADVSEIAQIDRQIMSQTSANLPAPNDLLDRRDQLIDEVSKLVNLTKTDQPDGSVKLQVGTFVLEQSGVATTVNTVSDLGSNLTSGKLGGLVAVDTAISGTGGYISKLDTFAASLITQVNAAQAAGYTLGGSQTSEPFFTGTDAQSIAVNPNLVADPSLVAASSLANQPGNGENALAIAGLRSSPTLDTVYQQLVTTIGSNSSEAQRSAANAGALADATANRRDSVMGVSIDEEMTNILKFQRGYQAAARVMSAMDEVIDTLINRTGRVGL